MKRDEGLIAAKVGKEEGRKVRDNLLLWDKDVDLGDRHRMVQRKDHEIRDVALGLLLRWKRKKNEVLDRRGDRDRGDVERQMEMMKEEDFDDLRVEKEDWKEDEGDKDEEEASWMMSVDQSD